MMNLVTFLNQNSGAVQSIFAAIVAIATAIYVFYTARMFGQMRYSNRRLEAADVTALLEPGRRQGSMFELTIRNSGNVPVYDVRIDVDPKDLPSLIEQTMGDLSLFRRAIPVMTEGQEIRTILFHYQDYAELESKSDTLTFSVAFKTPQGSQETRSYPYDLSLYEGLTDFTERGLNEVTKELGDLGKEMKKVVSATKDISTRLDWTIMFPPGEYGRGTDPSTVVTFFRVSWEDYKELGDEAYLGFSLQKLQAICERVHDELCRGDGSGDEYAEIRRNLLKMARKRFYLDGGKSLDEFWSLGNETMELAQEVLSGP